MNRENFNANYIQQLSVDEIRALLLDGFAHNDFLELETSIHRDIIKELNDAFQLLSPEQQDVFRQGIHQALLESVPPNYDVNVMEELIFLAAYTRTRAVTGDLHSLLEPASPLVQLEASQKERIESVIQAVLRGFKATQTTLEVQ